MGSVLILPQTLTKHRQHGLNPQEHCSPRQGRFLQASTMVSAFYTGPQRALTRQGAHLCTVAQVAASNAPNRRPWQNHEQTPRRCPLCQKRAGQGAERKKPAVQRGLRCGLYGLDNVLKRRSRACLQTRPDFRAPDDPPALGSASRGRCTQGHRPWGCQRRCASP